MPLKFIPKSEKETLAFAERFAKKLKGGEVICLVGDLGRGKTVFAKGLAKGLGIKKHVTSPTFVLMKLYKLTNLHKLKTNKHKLPANGLHSKAVSYLCHVDAYRIDNPEEMINIGLLEYSGRKDTVCVIEWADKITKILPKKRIEIKFKLGKSEKERIISILKLPAQRKTKITNAKFQMPNK